MDEITEVRVECPCGRTRVLDVTPAGLTRLKAAEEAEQRGNQRLLDITADIDQARRFGAPYLSPRERWAMDHVEIPGRTI